MQNKVNSVTIILISLMLSAGCATVNNNEYWGANTTIAPSFESVKDSAIKSIRSPYVWVPALCSLLLSTLPEINEDITTWAAGNNPVFGSIENASRVSDTLKRNSRYSYVATSLLTVSGNNFTEYLRNKSRAYLTGSVVRNINKETTFFIKQHTSGHRPNRRDYESFPSGHTSAAFVNAMLSYRNLDYVHTDKVTRVFMKSALMSMAMLTGWARVEAKEHWMSDVLAGAALGNFVANFFFNAYLVNSSANFNLKAAKENMQIELSKRF